MRGTGCVGRPVSGTPAGDVENSAAAIQTSAAPTTIPDSGSRDSTRDTTGSTARTHRPPVEATEAITESLRRSGGTQKLRLRLTGTQREDNTGGTTEGHCF